MKVYSILCICFITLGNYSFSQGSCTIASIGPSVVQPTAADIVSSTCSTLVVKWQGSGAQTYCVSASYFDTIAKQKQTITGTPNCDANQSCTATLPVITGAEVTWSVQAISNGSASYPVINVLEYPIPACGNTGSGLTFCGKVLLQGAYDADAKKMRNTLNTSGILQTQASSQPYNAAPFNYTGTENVGATFFADHPDIVDWVLLEIRDPNIPATVLGRRAAFVKQDGVLVDTGGTNTNITFPGLAPGKYHVAVKHRNHLGIRTNQPVDFTCGNTCYDFTSASFKSFKKQPYPSTVQTITAWDMRGGNANSNNNIRYTGLTNDANQILNAKLGGSLSRILTNQYAPEDVNMDGIIKWTGPGNDQTFLLNVALLGFLSTLFTEQL